ncbi:hypothetical protein SARC_06764 [Sphaeroforma arctica JP610]|uniref:Uncharacterized protein n=1 Tax=Sphaeroforma arctica JP610 TaxID=667725 RepID=A0A0L0FVL4_9EUKA|nr:hypothetical protein SARC_06764 [Sphaeroforma arctica JP610]KNC80895.1 hypothetical protein SARC_06764 [Sphaeroforma arctica JP610]|eukprot:XP_014154797.1 hypothetical protein SARC_06764 [Sphaeroforma arctica JP610]
MQTRLALNARKTRGVGPLLCGSLKRTTRANHVATPQKTHIQTLHLNELINKRPRLVKWLEERPQAGAAVGQLIDDTYGLFMNQKLVTPFFDAGWGNLDVVDFKKDSDEMLASIETSPLLEGGSVRCIS